MCKRESKNTASIIESIYFERFASIFIDFINKVTAVRYILSYVVQGTQPRFKSQNLVSLKLFDFGGIVFFLDQISIEF